MAERNVPTPQANGFDPARIGEADRPENDWGEPEAGAVHGGNHARRGEDSPESRLQGTKTRKATKDQISRRS
ncbi:hypothetical protein [uncultured Phenylobacterium sp.]|uniref:hypothetical protein n=1 Tax=uncultured Phenylobacterium sp. TaxID=349273 RepID=UPI0025EC4A71|nr:hypothetical protein [uncultured Phenylobacterium sp.]